jgi:tetratricopeptide (TPR) repeat protein
LFGAQQAKLAQLRADAQQAWAETRQVVLRGGCQAGLGLADDALARRDGLAANLQAEKVLGLIDGAPAPESLADLRAEAEDRQSRARQLLRALDMHRTFLRRRDDFLLYFTPFAGLEAQGEARAKAAAARDALAVVGVTPDGTANPAPDPLLTEQEQEQIRSGCYELLLLWAGTEARSAPREALRLLDRAARVGPETPAWHRLRADALRELKDVAAADKELAEAQAGRNLTPVDFLVRGHEQYLAGQPNEAAATFVAALRLQPDYFWARFFLAVCHMQAERPEVAEVALTACLQQKPDLLWAYLSRAIANAKMGHFDQAEEDFARASRLQPTDLARYSIAVNHGVMRMLQGQAQETAKDLREATKLRQEAAKDFRKAIELRPDLHHAYVNLAQAYEAQQAWDKAIEEIDKAIRLQPRLGSLHRIRALLLWKRKDAPDPAAAIVSLAAAIKNERPGSLALATYHRERGLILFEAVKHADALRDYDAALDINPQDAEAHFRRGEVLLAQKDYKGAVGAFNSYLGYGRPSAQVYALRARAHALLGDHAAAVKDYTLVLNQQDQADVYTLRGWTYLLESLRLARHDFEEAIRLNPKAHDAYNGRGSVRALLGERDAVKDAEEAARLEPRKPLVLHNAACVYARALAFLLRDGPPADRTAVATCLSYQQRSAELLRLALNAVPAEGRRTFWKETVAGDPALKLIRQSPEYQQLVREYGGPKP